LPEKITMQFPIHARVRFRYTGETGVVAAYLDDDLLSIRLDSDPGMTIPAYADDLQRADEPAAIAIIGGKNAHTPTAPPPPRRVLTGKGPIGDPPTGVQVAFEPMRGADDFVSRYKIWLLNDSPHDFVFEFDLYVGAANPIRLDDLLSTNTAVEIGDLLADDLNDSPEVEVSLERITTAGTDQKLFKSLKIKTKSFFKHYDFAPVLHLLAHTFLLFEKFEPASDTTSASAPEADLREYTKQKAAEQQRKKPKTYSSLYAAFDPEAFANFEAEIDLHIDALVGGRVSRIDPGETLRIQMQHFERFMERAVRLGVERVFVIHGVGEGRLREVIAQRLRTMPAVRKFKNEYHHKYGYGATEVIF
jgi:DNA-nicking Smr family endonuclease